VVLGHDSASSEIEIPDGSVVFARAGLCVPAPACLEILAFGWSHCEPLQWQTDAQRLFELTATVCDTLKSGTPTRVVKAIGPIGFRESADLQF
jgi:hypothetical protein